ncbi:unnamed protein product [Oikopleura dioica]|uniref:Sulfotransferase n=1 Tax=Oikopleura dioica TaxID=34765 RepID=E4Z2W0_OIKDI|nr:unnamed protein product [Oikopleura dioica]
MPKFLERKNGKEEKYRRKLKKFKKQFEEFKSSENAELFQLREANRELEGVQARLNADLAGKDKEIESLKPKAPIRKIGVRKWDRKAKLVFIHIGKAGGTSFGTMMSKELGKIDFVGARHFDWTYVEEVFPADEVLTLFREPVSRTISHFNFMKKLSWTKGMKIKEQSLDEFLDDKASMMEFRGCWQDGQAGVSWLTGTHIAEWVRKGENAEKDPETLERWFFDYEKQLTEAADKIDKMFWFGILEDLDRSLELLAFQLEKPVNHLKKITHQNLHKY